LDTIQAILVVETNIDFSREEFSKKLGVLKKRHSSDKYHATKRTSSSK
jgi:hypothetical protein